MKPAYYADDFNRSKMVPATLESALAHVGEMAAELARYGGRLCDFAFSMDAIDRWPAEALRTQSAVLAWNVVVGALSDQDVAAVHAAFVSACAGDEYAAKELAGRFMTGVRRVRVLRAIGQHPRGDRFSTLCEAIERGKFTAAQWALAQKLAAEVKAA